jgi:hypothetical protein
LKGTLRQGALRQGTSKRNFETRNFKMYFEGTFENVSLKKL